MPDRSVLIFAEIAAHPGDAFAVHDVIGVDHLFDAGDGGDVSADDDHRMRREFADHAAHLAHLADVDDDRRRCRRRRIDCVLSSRAKSSRVGKSSTVQGAEMFSWIIMMPHERWNMRSEKLPWARVT